MSALPETHGEPLRAAPRPHLVEPLWSTASANPDMPLLARRRGTGFATLAAWEVRDRVRRLAGGLVATGVKPGDRVALMSRTRCEWTLLDYAILAAGAVTVPLYDTSSPEQVRWTLEDSDAVAAVVETEEQRVAVEGLEGSLPVLRRVLAIDEGATDELARLGEHAQYEVETRIASLTPGMLSTIIYSSGTTGSPKGCALTHGSVCANVAQTAQRVPELFADGARTLVFLPLAHALAKLQVYVSVQEGALVGYATDLRSLTDELRMFRPTFIVGVPRVFEKIHDGARARARSQRRGPVFDRAASVAVRYSRERAEGQPGAVLRAQHAVFDRLVYAKLREAFGGALDYAISGGASLSERLVRLFDGIGLPIVEGYGLTEASPIVSGGPVRPVRAGTVGMPLPDTAVRADEEGELLVRGPQLFREYWKDEPATASALSDGWFRTGDLGTVGDDGYVTITGRKKELLITAGGKNVVPTVLEDLVREDPLVSQCVVVGEGKPFVAALVTVDPEALRAWARERDKGEQPDDLLLADPDLERAIDRAIERANATVSQPERIRSFSVLPHDLSVEAGELTPTLKVRRPVVTERYGPEIEALYNQARTG